ncbi:hypothetical protein [Enhygromyxa salina]|uniref:hypothetical protein n=1 Tax=Enhygromyxa salina TaxID=215803 RepID=UPI0011B282C0|nr:hypothetical protein [Enhygromyxa salina]
MIDKCAAISFGVDEGLEQLEPMLEELRLVVACVKPVPRGAGAAVDNLRSVLRKVPEGQRASVRLHEHVVELRAPSVVAPAASASMGFRCRLIRAGGVEPKIQISTAFQDLISVTVGDENVARDLSAYLYHDLHIQLRAWFDENFRIRRAKLVSWAPIDPNLDTMAELERWVKNWPTQVDEEMPGEPEAGAESKGDGS